MMWHYLIVSFIVSQADMSERLLSMATLAAYVVVVSNCTYLIQKQTRIGIQYLHEVCQTPVTHIYKLIAVTSKFATNIVKSRQVGL